MNRDQIWKTLPYTYFPSLAILQHVTHDIQVQTQKDGVRPENLVYLKMKFLQPTRDGDFVPPMSTKPTATEELKTLMTKLLLIK